MTQIPAALAPWSESLAGLDASLAMTLGPMLHVVDDLVSRLDDRAGETGEPDGFDGTTNRGDPGRLLVGEWLLAEEVPLEFLRRAAENELSYLKLGHRTTAPRGRVVVVCDTGPEQLGAGRLVQLAALVVLDRRARRAGAELVVVVAQDGQAIEGPLSKMLPRWLRARSGTAPNAAQVEHAMTADVSADDRVWLLAGPRTRALAPHHRRALCSWVTSWEANGPSEVTLRVGDATARLNLPASDAAVAALRGEGLLARGAKPAVATVPGTGRGALFGSADARLLWRGGFEDELYGCFVGQGDAIRVRRYRMGGTVLAAASLGRRLVAAVSDRERIWIRVVGKKLSRTDQINVSLFDLDLDPDAVDALREQPLQPLYLLGGSILLQTGQRWWSLDQHGAETAYQSAVAPGHALDAPRQAFVRDGRLFLDGAEAASDVVGAPVFGPIADGASWYAWSSDTRVWQVARNRQIVAEVGVADGDRVVGLCVIGSEPGFVVVSSTDRMIRYVTQRHTKTWTRWAGPAHFGVHPMCPWLVRTTPDRIVVGDLVTGNALLDVRTDQ